MIRNTLYKEWAAGDREQFVRQALRAKLNLSAQSVWRRLIDAQLEPSACGAARLPVCFFVL